MRIEKLNNDKIKVTLTTSDLINLDIDVKQLAPDSKELHTFLFHIMETIREETGFNPYSGQVVVEAAPSRDGISILVSRLNSNSKRITRTQFKKASSVKAKLKKSVNNEIFYFDNFDDLCSALKELESDSLLAGSLYRLNSTFCFAINSESAHEKCLSIMAEFSAGQSEYPLQMMYIKEHGQLVAKGRELLEMTEQIKQLT